MALAICFEQLACDGVVADQAELARLFEALGGDSDLEHLLLDSTID